MKTFNKIIFFSLIACASMFYACEDTIETPAGTDFGYRYFPADTGKYLIYQADSTIYDSFADTIIKKSFYIKEYYESEFLDNENRNSIRIERSYKDNLTDDWQLKDIWYLTKTDDGAERIEENVRFLKLVFPIKVDQSWNGNVFINTNDDNLEQYRDWNYVTTSKSETYNYLDLNFTDVVNISQVDDENFITKKYGVEQYARNVGLVFKELWILETDFNPEVIWPNDAKDGFQYTQRLIDFN